MNQPSPNDLTPPQQPAKPKASGCLLASGIGCSTMVVLAIVCVVILALNAKKMIVSGIRITATTAIEASELPPIQRQGIIVQIDRLTEAFNEGGIVLEDIGKLVKDLADGPLLVFGSVYYQVHQYIKASDMTKAQKKNAYKIIGRLAKGGIEQKIDPDCLKDMWPLMREQTGPNEQTTRETLTTEELAKLLQIATEVVTKANIPDETYRIDVADHLRKAVDKILGSNETVTTAP